ncbi:MAG: LOG family protein [Caldilineales bacterium]
MTTSLLITVFGGARVAVDSALYADCLELGRLLGEAGYAVATGGYQGSMEAVLRGAHTAGAPTVGYTCATFDHVTPNPWVMEERKTARLSARIQRLAEESAGFVVVDGGLGTLTELALVWNMLLAGELPRKPLVVMGTHWPRLLDAIYAETQTGSTALAMVRRAATPAAVCQALRAQP